MKEFFSDWFSLDGFNIWKLHTHMDYVYFGLILVGGFVLLWLVIRFLASRRTPEGTAARVEKQLRKLGGKESAVYRDVTIRSQRDHCSCAMLYANWEGVYVVQVYHFGLEVSGSASSKYWTLSYNKDIRQVDNPLDEMEEQIVVLNRLLGRAGIRGVPVEKLVIFADIYGRPSLSLRGVDCAVVRQDLPKWRKEKRKGSTIDLKGVKQALEASFQTAPNQG